MLYIECGTAGHYSLSFGCGGGANDSAPHYHCTFAKGCSMTTVEVLFRYGMPPGEREMGALGQVSDVYGIRRVRFDEQLRTIRVEYDATRLNESTVENLLRSAGFDVQERLALV
jgi:hypothetical protein